MSHALHVSNGFYDPRALAWVVTSAALAALAVSGLLPRGRSASAIRWLPAGILLGGLAIAFVQHATIAPGIFVNQVDRWYNAMLAVGAVATLLIVLDPRRARAWWFPALLLSYAGMGAWMVYQSPHPHIDVFTVYNSALHALRSGHSPYGLTFRNIYGTDDLYAPEMVQGSEVLFGFPYPPLALLMAIPGDALFDYRYANVAAMVGGAAALGYARGTRTTMLSSALLLFVSRAFLVIEQGWSEPFVICWLGLLAFAAVRRGRTWVPLGGLLAVKQHLILALPFAAWLRPDEAPRHQLREVALAIVAAGAVTVPFFIADPRGFWRSVVTLQFAEPFRWDSLSRLVPIARAGYELSPGMLVAIPVAALILAGLFAWRYAPRDPAGFSAALGFVLIVLFLVGKKAFCNYYFLVLACWCAAIAATPEPDTPVADFP